MSRRVVVTGGSCVSALGNEWPEIFASLKQKKNKIKYMPEWEKFQGLNTRLACPVDFTPPD
ncbi:MAG: beta-ketoacyl-ACP synthase, partial [Spirochaetia bacterium]|nr:beta-ketoacyl-ACP synthase [Spirochaetia bacterium]